MSISTTGFTTPKEGGGNCLSFLDHARVLKLLYFFKNDVGPRVKEFFEHILNDCPKNGLSLTKKITNFLMPKS